MWPLIITGLGVLAIREIVNEWGWTRDEKSFDSLPASPGTYILYSKRNIIIHIGSTSDLFKRISKHEKKSKTLSFDFYEAASFDEAYQMEMRLQKKHSYKGR